MADAAKPTVHRGTVKMVQSGDTVIIRGIPRGGPPPEKTLSLSGIAAPRLARRPNNGDAAVEKDEPMAWECREFLRKKLVGQSVSFTVEYSAGSRDYGEVFVGGESIGKSLISTGLAKVRREDDVDLMNLQSFAKTAGAGVWGDPAKLAKSVRDVKWTVENPADLVKKYGGKPVDAIIEHCRDGCNFRALLIPSMQSVSVSLTGIRTPMFRRNNESNGKDEPFAAEAKYFVEVRLLQREIKLVLEGSNGPTSVLASVLHPKGNVAEFLLKEGYAKVFDNSVNQVTTGREAMRAAEAAAKAKKLRIWKNHKVYELDLPAEERQFTATVVEVINPERIMVKKADGSRQEISLASVRQPRRPRKPRNQEGDGADAPVLDENGRKPRSRPLYEVPFMYKAREFLRERMIGKQVTVNVDFIKPADEPYPAKTCASLTVGTTNVAAALIGQGLATVLTHDMYRASNYDELLQNEFLAQSQQKGVHSKGDHAVHTVKVQEITSNDAAQRYVSSIQRKGRVDVVPEYITSGSRMRVFIPSETCLATFMFAGISVPRTGFKGSADEPFSVEATTFVKDAVMQRTCQIEVLGTDKNGNFIGNMYINGEFVAESLLRNGLGEMHFSATRYGIEPQLRGAQDSAQKAKVNMWANYDPSKVVVAEGESAATSGGKQKFETVVVTEVVDATSFYTQKTSSADALTELMGKLNDGSEVTAAADPRKNKLYKAKFSDDSWYRVKVTGTIEKGKTYAVLYIDYGNSEEIDISKIAELAEDLKETPAYATSMKLAVLSEPPEDYVEEATEILRQGILDQIWNCSIEYQDEEKVAHVTLINDETKDNVAMTMLSLGYARVGRTRERHLRDTENEFKKIQAEACESHVGMWMYGDISEDPKEI